MSIGLSKFPKGETDMKVKRMLCLLLTALMMLSMLGSFALGANADAVSESVKDRMILVDLSWTPANLPENITVDGKNYELTWGVNAFGNAQTAVDAAPEFGTVYLCPGGYVNTITIKKSLTLLGAKHGIDPNIRGAKESDLWTLNPERGKGETVVEATIQLGMNSSTVFKDYAAITVDGIQLSGNGQLTANNGAAGRVDLKIKNIYIKESTKAPTIYTTPYYNGAVNAGKRFITVDNMRIESMASGNVMTVTADGLDVSGVYMSPDCTNAFLSGCSASNGPTDEVYWNIHDNFFAAPVARVFYLNWYDHKANGENLTLGVANRSKIINNVYNNVFVDATVGFRFDKQQNVYFNYVGNAFYNENSATNANGLLYGWIDYANRGNYADQIVVKSNKFIGNFPAAYVLKWNTVNVDVSGNYSCINGTVCPMPLVENSKATEEWYWLDEAMTVKSNDENPGVGYAVNATQGLDGGKPVTVSNSLPDSTAFVDPAWTETTVPATITVRGKTFTLNWGVNAFADIASANAAVRDFGTIYLCAGTYSTATSLTKNMTILGPNFGIDPNVKGASEKELWTANPERGSEATIKANLNLGSSTGADNADVVTVDGIQLTGGGNLRANAATIGGYAKLNLKNISIKNNTTNPLYLFPYNTGGGSGDNTFRRDVTIENVRLEGYNNASSNFAIRLTAEHADISGVYVHTDCTQKFIDSATAANGPTSEVVWNLHDNQFAGTVGRGIYLNWESNPKVAKNTEVMTAGVAGRSKIINNVYNNTFVNFYNKDASSNPNRSLAARIKTENIYFNVTGNAFYQDNAIANDHIAFQFYSGSSRNYSDQIVFKNNRFIGNYASDAYFNQSTEAVDVSGNYAVKDGTVRPLVISGEAETYVQNYYYLDAAMTRRSDDTSVLLAPSAVAFESAQLGTGCAGGTVTVTLPADHGAEEVYLFWGDEGGKLDGYTAFAPVAVAGDTATVNIKNGTRVPEGATRLLAYSYSDACGVSEEYASVALPADAVKALGTPVAELQMVGDMHITTTTSGRFHHSDHLLAMLEDIKVNSPDSMGIFSNGDLADRGYDADYKKFLSLYNSVEGAADFYPAFGNHETFSQGVPIPDDATLDQFKELFFANLGDYIPDDAEYAYEGSLSYCYVKNGYKFITLGTDVLDQNDMILNASTIEWLKTQLDANRDKTRPTFIIMHQTMADTVGDGDNACLDAVSDAALKELFKDYPEVFVFNGHTHTSLYDSLSSYFGVEGAPSYFNCSSVGYIPADSPSGNDDVVSSEGYYVEIYEDQIVIKGRDFINGKWIASAQYIVELPEAEPVLPEGEAVIGDQGFDTLKEALQTAKAGDTVELNKDVTVDYITVNPSVTLDINGKTLTANYIIGFNGSVICGEGKLLVAKDKVALDRTNGGYLPVYDGKGYEFITVSTQEMKQASQEDTVYYFLPDLSAAHAALLEGAASSGVKVVVRLSWSKAGNYTATQDYTYVDRMVETVIHSYNEAIGEYDQVFTATFTGTEAGKSDNLKVSAVLISDTGVEIASQGLDFDK